MKVASFSELAKKKMEAAEGQIISKGLTGVATVARAISELFRSDNEGHA